MELHYRKAVIITKLLKNTVLEAEKKRRSAEKPERKLIPPSPATHVALQTPPCNARRTLGPYGPDGLRRRLPWHSGICSQPFHAARRYSHAALAPPLQVPTPDLTSAEAFGFGWRCITFRHDFVLNTVFGMLCVNLALELLSFFQQTFMEFLRFLLGVGY